MREPRGRMLPTRSDSVTGLDGRRYPTDVEAGLNLLCARVLGTSDGQQLLNYLRGITLNLAFPGSVATNELLHMEGQRYIVGLLMARHKAGSVR